jgi:hypothetical protein
MAQYAEKLGTSINQIVERALSSMQLFRLTPHGVECIGKDGKPFQPHYEDMLPVYELYNPNIGGGESPYPVAWVVVENGRLSIELAMPSENMKSLEGSTLIGIPHGIMPRYQHVPPKDDRLYGRTNVETARLLLSTEGYERQQILQALFDAYAPRREQKITR